MGKEQIGFDGQKLLGEVVRQTRQSEKGMQKLGKKNRIESRAQLADNQSNMGM